MNQTIINETKITTVQELMDLLKNLSPESKIEGPFGDEILALTLFDKDTGNKILSLE